MSFQYSINPQILSLLFELYIKRQNFFNQFYEKFQIEHRLDLILNNKKRACSNKTTTKY